MATPKFKEESGKVQAPGFLLTVTGEIESGDFSNTNNLYCKYNLNFGPDWNLKEGTPSYGITQLGRKTPGENPFVVWNFPFECTFKSTNCYGWPQICVAVFGHDMLGRDIIRGYGSTHIPFAPGSYTRYIQTYAPRSSSLFQQYLNYLFGMRAEFIDPVFTAKSAGREVTRVRSSGTVKITFNVVAKDLATFGYSQKGRLSTLNISWINEGE